MMCSLPFSEESIKLCAKAVLAGDAVVYPTETMYGIAVDALSPTAVKKLFAIKKRKADKPLPVIVGDRNMLELMVRNFSQNSLKLMEHFWPGPLTLIFDATKVVPSVLTADTGTVAVRLSSCEAAQRLASSVGRAITATSANTSGKVGAFDPEEIKGELGTAVSLMIDVGKFPPSLPSTIVDARGEGLLILREGVISSNNIFEVLGKRSNGAPRASAV